MNTTAFLEAYLDELRACLAQLDLQQVERVIEALQQAREDDRAVFVLGNGGSAATAAHLASDLCRTEAGKGTLGLRAVCLTDNVAALSATANDTGYEGAFAELLALQLRGGDVVIAISGSGGSENVLRAVDLARRSGATTVGLIGFGGGALLERVDLPICVDSRHYGAVEDLHLAVGHMIAMALAGDERIAHPDRRPSSSLRATPGGSTEER